jgi:hypothetical protein
MRIPYYLGWIALALAFAAAATEPFLVQLGKGGFMTSSHDLWYALAPGNLVVTEIRMEREWPALWDPYLVTLLQAPAWLLAGVPGVILVWYCHPNRIMSPGVREEYERQRESLFVIDELSDQALLDETYDPHEDDQAPSHLLFNLHEDEDEDIRNSIDPEDVPAGYPGLDYADDYMADLKRDRDATEELKDHIEGLDDPDQIRIVDGLAFSGSDPEHVPDHAEDTDNDDSAEQDQSAKGPDKPLP